MYLSQNLRQSWYGNLLGDEDNDKDQDTIKVKLDDALQHRNTSLVVFSS